MLDVWGKACRARLGNPLREWCSSVPEAEMLSAEIPLLRAPRLSPSQWLRRMWAIVVNQKSIWSVLLTIYIAAIWMDWGNTVSGPVAVMYIWAALVGYWLPQRYFFALVTLLAVSTAAPLLWSWDQSGQWIHRLIGFACLAGVVAARMRFDVSPSESSELSESFEVGGETAFIDGSTVDDEEVSGLAELSIDDPSDEPEPEPEHTTHVHETHHRRKKEPGEFALDAGETRDYVEPALDRLRSTGNFNEAQMKMISIEMRALEERGLVVDFVSCLPAGTQVGRFIIQEALGRGGEGNVYRAHDDSGHSGAIKILHNMKVSDRFRREMHLVRQLAHPNIVTAYEVGEFRGLPFITMELLAGPDLYHRVKDSGPIGWHEATQFILQASRALAHAHKRGLVHRDVKPGNMILHGGDTIKLVDLGLAAMGNSSAESMDSVFRFQTQDGHLAGTLPFMAPEQARSLANATIRSDIYGLGATWYYLLTGRERLRGKTFSQQFENLLVHRRFNALPRDQMPQPLVDIYQKMVKYDWTDRYESCEEVCAAIETALKESGKSVLTDQIDVLVIEDSRTDMLFTIEMLRRSNSSLTIHKARSLAGGIDICRKMDIGLALLDLSLPDSNGVETVSRFRKAIPNVPLVVLTGMTKDEVGADCLAAGADTFVSKHGLTAHRMERTIFVTLSRHSYAKGTIQLPTQNPTTEAS